MGDEDEKIEVEMGGDDFVELIRAVSEAGGMTQQDMHDRGWPSSLITLVVNLRHAVKTHDAMKELD